MAACAALILDLRSGCQSDPRHRATAPTSGTKRPLDFLWSSLISSPRWAENADLCVAWLPLITLELHSHFTENCVLSWTSLNTLCLVTGWKPVTANHHHHHHHHLRPCTSSSGSKANIGRDLQLSPNLCPSSSIPNHSSSPQHRNSLLTIARLFFSSRTWNIIQPPHISLFFVPLAACHSSVPHLTAFPCLLILSKPFTADTSTFFEDGTFEKKNTPALSPPVTPQPQPALLLESEQH